MAFPRAGSADQDHVLGRVHELAPMQLAHEGFVDFAGGEVEAGQILVGREARGLHVIGDGAHLAFRHFSLEQLRQHRHCCLERWGTLLHEIMHGLRHASCWKHASGVTHLQAA